MVDRAFYRIDWDEMAFDRGFTDDKTMLEDMYVNRGMTQEKISLELKICAKKVGDQMKLHSIPVRRYGGTKLGRLRGPRLPREGVK